MTTTGKPGATKLAPKAASTSAQDSFNEICSVRIALRDTKP